MNNSEKLEKLLNAIDDIETFKDGSIIIRWTANVSHEVPGHLLNVVDGSVVLKGHQVHFNPELASAIKTINFNEIQEELDIAIQNSKKLEVLQKVETTE